MKKLIAILLALTMLAALTACGSEQPSPVDTGSGTGSAVPEAVSVEGKTVGISVPNRTSQRWLDDSAALTALLEELGCRVLLQDAQDDALLQADQVEKMIAQPVDCLVIAAIDSLTLIDALQQAKTADIPVIAYDRLLMNTDAITYYAAIDSEAVGAAIGDYIVNAKQLQTAQEEGRSYTIEFFMGSPDDNNAVLLHRGVMGVLQSYLDSGVLVCRSGRVSFEDTCIHGWSSETAQAVCGKYLADIYTDAEPDILCAASDSLAEGCSFALEEACRTVDEGWPLITGQDADLAAVRRILLGQQAMTVYKDTDALVRSCVELTKAALSHVPADLGGIVCSNAAMDVPSVLCAPAAVDAQNYWEVLIDSGCYTEEQLTGEIE